MTIHSGVVSEEELARRYRLIAGWLLAVAAMIFLMVVLGGVTRLTHSGLSMVEWKPVTGWLPPLGAEAWSAAFENYKAYPQYQKLNLGMTLEDFKSIFWPEYLHRIWGRVIGLAFFLPFALFLLKGWIKGRLTQQLLMMFILGGLQGALGWYMVKSGMVDRPDVSQYRLTAHLGLAIGLFGYIVWTALGLLGRGLTGEDQKQVPTCPATGLVALVFLTILSGGFVAGLDAGFSYNTFPLMDGELIPDGLFDLSPAYLNVFENIMTVQFNHRVLAMTTLAVVFVVAIKARRIGLSVGIRKASHSLMMMVVLQVFLGITTLLFVVPVPVAAAHQAGAVILFGIAVWFLRELCPREEFIQ